MVIHLKQFAQLFGSESGSLVLPRGVINAKVEGTINNANNPLTTDPGKAFYARTIHRAKGPVIPSKVITLRTRRRRSITPVRFP